MKRRSVVIIIITLVVLIFGVVAVLVFRNSPKEEYTETLPIEFNVVAITNPSVVNELVATTDSFKISYSNCESGSADVYVVINGENYATYTIPEKESKASEYVIPCNAGDSIKVTITTTMGYSLAKGTCTVEY